MTEEKNEKKKPVLHEQLGLGRCSHCRVARPVLVKVWETPTVRYDATNQRCWRIYKCTRCGGLITACAPQYDTTVSEMYPSHFEADVTIPEKARNYLNQAMNSLQNPAGAVMLAASAVDEFLKQKGYTQGKLYPRINKAEKEHIITKDMAKWAHQVRLNANNQRHADQETNLPTEEEAKRSVEFATALAEFLFVLPSRVSRGLEESTTEKIIEEPKTSTNEEVEKED